jgi:chaperonin GroEL
MAPIKKMLSNSAHSEQSIGLIIESILLLPYSNGFNLKTGNYEDLMKTGVVDPAKVIRCALQNAASVAGAVIGSDYLLIDEL